MSKMDLPRQLQRQQEEVERIDREIAEAAAAPPPQPTPTDPQQPTGQEPPQPTPAPVPPPQPQDDQWEQRFRTLKGKYDAEVPRLHQQLRELQAQVSALAIKPPVEPPPTEKPKTRRVTEKDAETYGADMLDVIKRQAEEITADRLAEIEAKLQSVVTENESLKAQLGNVAVAQGQTSQEVYFAKLTGAVAEWQTINVDPKFLEWLGEVDPLSGELRQAMLDRAFNALNVERTAAVFNAYKASLPPAPSPAPAPRQQEIQRQVTPGKSKTPPGPPPASDAASKIWTTQEIEKFYAEVRAGQYRTNPQEAARIESEIDAAVATGRVR